jgi:hypothetical protein
MIVKRIKIGTGIESDDKSKNEIEDDNPRKA